VVSASFAENVKAFGKVGTITFVEFAMGTAASVSMQPPGTCNS